MNTAALKRIVLLILVAATISSATPLAQVEGKVAAGPLALAQAQAAASAHDGAEPFIRTELYFGTARQDLPPVTDEEWRGFLNNVISEKFPDGLTVLPADGQFKDHTGNIVKEKSFVVILMYPLDNWRISDRNVELIRRIYSSAFHQESVLRVDYPLPVRVSF